MKSSMAYALDMEQQFNERAFRDALGSFATGVTVITTMSKEGPLGITANSFASVSLDPPLVLWSPARKSARFPAFEAATHFTVHILASDQQELSNSFAGQGLEPFNRFPHTEGLGRAPLLEGCAARLQCTHSAGHDGGDHLIVVGQVEVCETWDRAPLVYYKGGYADLSS